MGRGSITGSRAGGCGCGHATTSGVGRGGDTHGDIVCSCSSSGYLDGCTTSSGRFRHLANVAVEVVKVGAGSAIHIGPPLAHKDLLVENGSVGAEEGALDGLSIRNAGANVEHLASGFRVSVESVKFANAGEGSYGDFVKDGIVSLGVAGDGFTEIPEGNFIINDSSSLRSRSGGSNGSRSARSGGGGAQDVLVASVGIAIVVVSRSAGGLNDRRQIFG